MFLQKLINRLPVFLILSTIGVAQAAPVPPESQILLHGHAFSYYSNSHFDTAQPNIEQAIIVIHGSERNADTYYNTMNVLATQAGKGNSTFIISAHYKLPSDPLIPGEFTFTDEGWLRGDFALNDANFGSFDIMDSFLSLLGNKNLFPNLKTILVTGHSAGGQFTQRYAIGTSIDTKIPDVHVRFIVTNPGSYTYLNADRFIAPGTFAAPRIAGCAYNDYKFGLDHLNAYQASNPFSLLVPRYLSRDITYFVGEADVLTAELDNSCEAEAQGHTRFERGSRFKAFLDHEYPGNHQPLITVPGVGHTEWGMYSSALGKGILFPAPSAF